MKGLDLSKFQKVSADKGTVTMQHADGHKLIIAVKSLPTIQQQQLKRLKMAKGGMAATDGNGSGFGGKYADGGDVEDDSMSAPNTSHDTHITINTAPAPTVPVVAPQVATSAPGQNILSRAGGGSPTSPPQGTAPSNQVDPVTDANAGEAANTLGANALQQQAVGEQAGVESAKAEAQVPLEEDMVRAQQKIAQEQIQNMAELKKHTDEFKSHIYQNPINPNAYQESMSSGQKVMTGLGLLFGGFKQGFSGGNNPAMDFLNKQIDRDIDAQKARAANEHTVWGAYEHMYGDSNIATNLAKVSANDILVHKAQVAAAKLGTPQAKATADALAAQKELENTKLRTDAAAILGQKKAQQQNPQGQPTAATTSSAGTLPPIQPILHSGAQQIFNGLPYVPQAAPEYADIKAQFTHAQQVDKALANLGQTFDTMSKNATISGEVEQDLAKTAGQLPWHLGEVLHAPVKLVSQGDPQNKIYNSAKASLFSDIKAAMPDIGDETLNRILEENKPLSQDTFEVKKQKRDTLEGLLRRTPKRSLIDKYHLTR